MTTYPDFFMEGPDVQAAVDDMQDDWTFPAALSNYALAQSSPLGGYAIRVIGGTSADLVIQRSLPNAYDYIIAGWRGYYPNIVSPTAGDATAARLLIISGGTTQRLKAWITTGGGDLAVRLGSSGSTVHLSVPNYVIQGPAYYEVEIYRHETDGFVGFYRDGNLMGSLTGDTTGLGGTINRLALGAPTVNGGLSPNGARLRDIYFSGLMDWDVIGENAIGAIDVIYIPPDADVDAYQGFVPSDPAYENADMVDESPQDGDTTYNESPLFGAEDLFTHAGSLQEIGIFAVGVVLTARKPETGLLGIHPVIVSGASRLDGTDYNPGATYRSRLGLVATLDPDGDGAWSQASVDALQFGYQNEADY